MEDASLVWALSVLSLEPRPAGYLLKPESEKVKQNLKVVVMLGHYLLNRAQNFTRPIARTCVFCKWVFLKSVMQFS